MTYFIPCEDSTRRKYIRLDRVADWGRVGEFDIGAIYVNIITDDLAVFGRDAFSST